MKLLKQVEKNVVRGELCEIREKGFMRYVGFDVILERDDESDDLQQSKSYIFLEIIQRIASPSFYQYQTNFYSRFFDLINNPRDVFKDLDREWKVVDIKKLSIDISEYEKTYPIIIK